MYIFISNKGFSWQRRIANPLRRALATRSSRMLLAGKYGSKESSNLFEGMMVAGEAIFLDRILFRLGQEDTLGNDRTILATIFGREQGGRNDTGG